ncbi:MAG: GNAT family N-acetyltransferase [Caulobacterales bacterium]
MISPLALEIATLDTWRAQDYEAKFGWRLLASGGVTGRVNAVWPIGWTGEASLEAAIAFSENWYVRRGLRACFKVAESASAPAGLSEALVARGYLCHTPTLVMVRGSPTGAGEPRALPGADGIEVALQSAPDGAFDLVFGAASTTAADLAERRGIVARTPPPRAYAVARSAGTPAAIGMVGVNEAGLAGLYAMRTVPAFRRRGLARAVVGALAAYATAQGAHAIFLQVEAGNLAAIRLYEGLGFGTAYAYSYWHDPECPLAKP